MAAATGPLSFELPFHGHSMHPFLKGFSYGAIHGAIGILVFTVGWIVIYAIKDGIFDKEFGATGLLMVSSGVVVGCLAVELSSAGLSVHEINPLQMAGLFLCFLLGLVVIICSAIGLRYAAMRAMLSFGSRKRQLSGTNGNDWYVEGYFSYTRPNSSQRVGDPTKNQGRARSMTRTNTAEPAEQSILRQAKYPMAAHHAARSPRDGDTPEVPIILREGDYESLGEGCMMSGALQ